MTKIQPMINFAKISQMLNFSNASKNDKKMHFLKQKNTFFDKFFGKFNMIAQKSGNLLRNILKTKSPQSFPSKRTRNSIAK